MFQKIYKMRSVFALIVFVLFSLNIKSQDLKVGIRTGFGSYKLGDLKELQMDFKENVDISSVESVETFPSSVFYSGFTDYSINLKNQIGLDFSYYSTGARNHVLDYSGEYKLDMLLSAYRFGFYYRYSLFSNNKFNFCSNIAGGYLFTSINVNELLVLNNEGVVDEKQNFSSESIFLEPAFLISYNLYDKVCIDLKCGYEIDFKGEMHFDNDKDEKIGIKSDWSGFRISLGLNYAFGHKDK